jgi:transposase
MTLPPSYSWYPVGEQLCLPYEAPQGRRVNALGAYFKEGLQAGRFEYETYATLPKSKAKKHKKTPEEHAAAYALTAEQVGPIDSERFVQFVWKVAGRPAIFAEDWKRARPLMIKLDNYSVHKSEQVKAALPALEAADVYLVYLPSYSPELSDIEPVWKDTKHHRMQKRSYERVAELKTGVDDALAQKAAQLREASYKTTNSLQRAA